MTFKPLLAATMEKESDLKFPLAASRKLDGIRALVIDGVLVSRNLKPIKNKYIQSLLGKHEYNGLDGELIVHGATDPSKVFAQTSSGVMSSDGEPDFTYFVFDDWHIGDTADFNFRIMHLQQRFDGVSPFIKVLEHTTIHNVQQLLEYETEALEEGYEGVMLRSPAGYYKQGRSTMKEQILMKVKRFADYEAQIIGFEERMHNANEATKNALGRTERSSHQENMVGRGDLGAFRVEMIYHGEQIQFNIGSGMDDTFRAVVWKHKEKYLGQLVKFKCFEYGAKDAPRFPIFLGIRDKADMS